MNLRIHDADVVGDRDRLVAFLAPNLDGHGGAGRYDWMYLRNPAGRARAWIAEDQTSGHLVGAAAAFPRRVRVGERTVTCWNLGDFAISPECRSLGPAIKLQRACIAPVLAGEIPFAYDHPSRAMRAVYARLGVSTTGEVVRHARVLRTEPQLRQRVKLGPLAGGLGIVADVALSVWRPLPASNGIAVRRFSGPFDARIAGTWKLPPDDAGIAIERTPEYLEWRYRACPVYRCETFVADRDGEPLGYLVVRQEAQHNAMVADLVAPPDAAAALLGKVAAELRARGVGTLSVPLLAGGRQPFPAPSWGFVPRESSPFVVTVAPDGEFAGVVDRAANWYLANGDRDV